MTWPIHRAGLKTNFLCNAIESSVESCILLNEKQQKISTLIVSQLVHIIIRSMQCTNRGCHTSENGEWENEEKEEPSVTPLLWPAENGEWELPVS